MRTPLTIAHLSDVHLGPIRGFGPRYWNLKRLTGYLNWQRRRRSQHQRGVLDRLVADLKLRRPDHIVVTGDLANIGLPQEHIDALAWLHSLGPPDRVSVIPGNHDIYARAAGDPGTERWAAYMSSDPEAGRHLGAADVRLAAPFPFVRVRAKVALIGLNSALPTPPLIASGMTGREQLARLGKVLDSTRRAGLFRLVLIHHPPLPGQASPTRSLKDAVALQEVLYRHGAELVIHGHNHRNMLIEQASSSGVAIPIVGVPSASLAHQHGEEELARYNLYRITGPPWMITLLGRGLAEPDGDLVDLERRRLSQA
jgi:3',5'-cyclic AMP phosphodiesterase CpdA